MTVAIVTRWLFGAIAVAALLLGLGVCQLRAQPPDPDHPGRYHDWFESQVIPPGDPMAGHSCCKESDGHIIEEDDWRIAGGHYEVRIDGSWNEIPESRILPESRNPTGHPVIWYINTNPPSIFCFAPGTGA